jgi:hypothetical protein
MGDFGLNEYILKLSWVGTFIFWFAVILMNLILFNLLVGILTGVMEQIVETKTQSDYAALCSNIFDLEAIMFWVSKDKKHPSNTKRHLIFAEEIKEIEQETTDKMEERFQKIE